MRGWTTVAFSRGDVVLFDGEYVGIVTKGEDPDWIGVHVLLWEWRNKGEFKNIQIHRDRLVTLGSLTEAGLY